MDRDDQTLNEGRIDQPLSGSDSSWVRYCSQCGGRMTVAAKEVEEMKVPGRESGLRFACESCNHSVWIASTLTTFTNFGSAALILSVMAYAFNNGLVDFIVTAFGESLGWLLGAVFLALLVLAFALGSLLNLISGIGHILQRKRHRLLAGTPDGQSLIVTALLGLAPWILAVIAGMLNDRYLNADTWFGYALVPIIFAPILLAPKLNASMTGTFFASALWLVLGVSVIWMT